MSLTTPDCHTEFPVFFRNIEGFTLGVIFPIDVPITFADVLLTFDEHLSGNSSMIRSVQSSC